jgi:hypothetical protein
MLDFLSHKKTEDAIDILEKDHEKVKDLFDQFEDAKDLRQKKKIVADAIQELRIHATIEEEIFYPALRKKSKVDKDLLNEADEEHHVAKVLIAELSQMDGSEEHFEVKFTVLAENIRHHIKEEEGDLFPQARKTDLDFDVIGAKLLSRKQQLLKNGIPESAEEKILAMHKKGSFDSPALTAERKKKPAHKTAAAVAHISVPSVTKSKKVAAGKRA